MNEIELAQEAVANAAAAADTACRERGYRYRDAPPELRGAWEVYCARGVLPEDPAHRAWILGRAEIQRPVREAVSRLRELQRRAAGLPLGPWTDDDVRRAIAAAREHPDQRVANCLQDWEELRAEDARDRAAGHWPRPVHQDEADRVLNLAERMRGPWGPLTHAAMREYSEVLADRANPDYADCVELSEGW